jgi:L-ascorbate metabolism protein UlaG (beta-lactamase superfamily)
MLFNDTILLILDKQYRGCMKSLFSLTLMMIAMQNNFADEPFARDALATSKGELCITFIGHASLMLEFNHLVIHVDPVSDEGDYSLLPKADLVLVTHHHGDHFDPEALQMIMKADTKVCLTQKCPWKSTSGIPIVMNNGDKKEIKGISIEAVPAYNIQHIRSPGNPFHPKGEGNGYILMLGDKRLYIAGDTENTPEMKSLKNIDIAFLPMNLPYTMTPEMVADAAKAIKPSILYPYHLGTTDTEALVRLMSDSPGTEVRIRDMK